MRLAPISSSLVLLFSVADDAWSYITFFPVFLIPISTTLHTQYKLPRAFSLYPIHCSPISFLDLHIDRGLSTITFAA
jgi:hypothetical protein